VKEDEAKQKEADLKAKKMAEEDLSDPNVLKNKIYKEFLDDMVTAKDGELFNEEALEKNLKAAGIWEEPKLEDDEAGESTSTAAEVPIIDSDTEVNAGTQTAEDAANAVDTEAKK